MRNHSATGTCQMINLGDILSSVSLRKVQKKVKRFVLKTFFATKLGLSDHLWTPASSLLPSFVACGAASG